MRGDVVMVHGWERRFVRGLCQWCVKVGKGGEDSDSKEEGDKQGELSRGN